jgi:hypothetical protein
MSELKDLIDKLMADLPEDIREEVKQLQKQLLDSDGRITEARNVGMDAHELLTQRCGGLEQKMVKEMLNYIPRANPVSVVTFIAFHCSYMTINTLINLVDLKEMLPSYRDAFLKGLCAEFEVQINTAVAGFVNGKVAAEHYDFKTGASVKPN